MEMSGTNKKCSFQPTGSNHSAFNFHDGFVTTLTLSSATIHSFRVGLLSATEAVDAQRDGPAQLI